jgi:sugar lactone lactonase YvrE
MPNSSNEEKRSNKLWLIPLALLVLFLAIWILPNIVFWLQYRGMPIAAQTGGFAPDCIWSATVQTWVDMNGNSLRDPSDPPLPGVTFHVNDTLNGYSDVGNANSKTDWKGETRLSVWLPGCPNARFEIYPDTLTGYNALPNSRPIVDVKSTDKVFNFGFSQLSGMPTVTPRPPSPTCVSYHLGLANQYDITDIAIAQDESVWVATYNDGLRKLPFGSQEWEYINTGDGLVNNQVRSITPLNDGSIWFGTEGGAAHLSSNGWESLTINQGLINNSVYDIAAASDGDLWFATGRGISHLDVQTMKWNSVPWDSSTHAITISPDGMVWAAPFLGNPSQVIDQGAAGLRLESKVDFDSADELVFATDGTMWMAGFNGIGQYNPLTGTLNLYNSSSTSGAFVDSANDLAIAPDGSIWIAAGTLTPTVYHFIPWLDTSTSNAWQIYDHRDGLPTLSPSETNNDTVQAIAIAPSGDIWVATTEHATRCHFDK